MPILIIAEAGVNHNGDLATARQMALAAKNAGADIVKFQTAVPELVASRFAEKAGYQKETTGGGESQLDMIRRLHFDFEGHRELKDYCDSIGITYLSSAFDLPSIDFLAEMQPQLWKIPSGEITNLPYLEKVAAHVSRADMPQRAPVLLSTGMCTLPEIEDALSALEDGGAGDITLLHCNTQYPTPFEDANLLAMRELSEVFGLPVGYSDHTPGIVCPVAAAALGAVVLEKHFTLDKNSPGPDHAASLDVAELAEMVRAVRACEAALGSGKKTVSASEAANRDVARKSIVAARAIRAGEVFTEENITTKRPGTGLSPMRWHEILGQRAARDFEADELIEL